MKVPFNHRIAKIWDLNLKIRAEDIENGTDLTYRQVIMPWVLSQLSCFVKKEHSILDIGCGCGYLTNAVYEKFGVSISGIDISSNSIAYAKKKYPHLIFEHRDLYNDAFQISYDSALAIVVLNNMPDLADFFSVVYKALKSGGHLVLVIPHPVFWTKKHLNSNLFLYMKEDCYSVGFSTKGRSDYAAEILYFHRPLSTYLNCIAEAGFQIKRVCELCEITGQHAPDLLGFVIQKPIAPDEQYNDICS